MAPSEIFVSLIVIRAISTVLFLVLFIRARERRHLVLFFAWLFYAIAGLSQQFLGQNPILDLVGFGAATVTAMVLLNIAAISYIHPRILKNAWVPVIGAGAASAIVATTAAFGTVPMAVLILQFATLAATFGVYLRSGRYGRRPFPGAPYAVFVIWGSALVYVALNAFLDVSVAARVSGTALLNVLIMTYFVYSEHALVLADARRSAIQIRQAEESVGIGYWERDLRTQQATWSAGHYRIFGIPEYSRPPLSWTEFLDYVHPDDRALVRQAYVNTTPDGHTETVHYRIVRPDGAIRWVSSQAVTHDGRTAYGIMVDITSLKRSLQEKETLLMEIHHRVKNNLQIISSMIQLQVGAVDDPAVDAMVQRLDDRIQAMAAVQELLLDVPDLTAVSMPDLVKRLVAYQRDSRPESRAIPGRSTIVLDLEEIELNAYQAFPVGTIVTELVSNAITHAFADRGPGTIRVSLTCLNGRCRLTVSDDGVGMGTPDGAAGNAARDPAARVHSRLGMVLVESLVGQLDGAMEIKSDPGTSISVEFDRASRTTEDAPVAPQ